MNTINEDTHYKLLMHTLATKSLPTKCLCCWAVQKHLRKMSLRVTTSNGLLRKAYKVQLCTTGTPHIPRLAPAVAVAL